MGSSHRLRAYYFYASACADWVVMDCKRTAKHQSIRSKTNPERELGLSALTTHPNIRSEKIPQGLGIAVLTLRKFRPVKPKCGDLFSRNSIGSKSITSLGAQKTIRRVRFKPIDRNIENVNRYRSESTRRVVIRAPNLHGYRFYSGVKRPLARLQRRKAAYFSLFNERPHLP